MGILPTCMFAWIQLCLVPMKGKGGCQIPWNWSYRCLLAIIWELVGECRYSNGSTMVPEPSFQSHFGLISWTHNFLVLSELSYILKFNLMFITVYPLYSIYLKIIFTLRMLGYLIHVSNFYTQQKYKFSSHWWLAN